MRYLLNALYLILLALLAPWLIWDSFRRGKSFAIWRSRWSGNSPNIQGDRRSIWLHAVSVGEVQLLQPLVQQLQKSCPDFDLVLSITTQSGYQLAAKLYPELARFYAPLDFSWSIERVFRRLHPDLLILAELEVWPNLILGAKRHGCSVAIVNGRLSDRSFLSYQRLGWLTRSIFRRIDWVGAQDETYAERFRASGCESSRVEVTGSMKFDNANFDRRHPEVLSRRQQLGLQSADRVWVVGSTQSPEESICLEAYRKVLGSFPDLRMILVPRHPERFDEVAEQLEQSGFVVYRRSQTADQLPADWQILLGDTLGELRWWWGLADLGFVGGSFGNRGGQNMIEPAGYGVCVSFGPNTQNFRDVVHLLLDAQAATVLDRPQDLADWLQAMLTNERQAELLGSRAQDVAKEHRGATSRTTLALQQRFLIASRPVRRVA
jgi:3-deoxy-D-manno-octulosonic-acid transferase